MTILGISAYFHDSAAALLKDGQIIAAAQEERFTRKKNDPSFPLHAVKYCLQEAKHTDKEPLIVAYYEKPITKFSRILETSLETAPFGLSPFLKAMPVWLKQKLWVPLQIEKNLTQLGLPAPENIFYLEHHQSHAASAFYPSPYQNAAILTIDGVGEWTTTAISHGQNNEIKPLQELHFPHSLGLLYSAFTAFTGFKVNSGEYKLMGLAPYGTPKYTSLIYEHLLDLKEDGSFRLNMDYFGYLHNLEMTNSRFAKLFAGAPRTPESAITTRELDLAASIQKVTEEVTLRLAKHAQKITGEKNLCLAGGVALNCVANARLQDKSPFENIWIQPAAGDSGAALGAALAAYHHLSKSPRKADGRKDLMQGSYLGPQPSHQELEAYLPTLPETAKHLPELTQWAQKIAKLLSEGKVVGLLQGRMEYGPRALGARSILADARHPKMQSILNQKIKFRESFRPFAPACLEEDASKYFESSTSSPYMLFTTKVKKELRLQELESPLAFSRQIHSLRSTIPAITHIDYSARLQTVTSTYNPKFYQILQAFKELTGCSLLANTSFNIRGEPIVCTPQDAYACFQKTEMDVLVLEEWLLEK